MLESTLASTSTEPLLVRFQDIRTQTLRLCRNLEPDDFCLQSMADASPPKWHLAHTTWFFENFVLAPLGIAPFHPRYGYLFNSYYNAVGPRHARPQRGLLSRPTTAEVLDYRTHVDEAIARNFGRLGSAARAVLELGLHHEQQHQELLLTDLKHAFFQNPLRPAYQEVLELDPVVAPPLRWNRFKEGVHCIGHAGPGFSFDNEGPRHRVLVPGFALASRPVTCREYLAFMEDGGYQRPELWLSDGWDAVRANGWEAPLYWEKGASSWELFTLHGMQRVDPDEPVCHVSYYEADAYARWAEARLPTEFEWEVAACGVPRSGNLAEAGRFHPAPMEAGPSFDALFGDVWEWTSSGYAPYPGYRPEAGALGEYNGKFMCNQLVLRGGSCLTPEEHIRSTYRNFFPPSARWQMSGIRLARNS